MTSSTSTPRVTVITGGSGGIGRVTAERLAADGHTVVIVYAGNDAAARDAVDAITVAGGSATAIKADVADEEQLAAVFDTVEREHGGVDVVVNAAGIMRLSTVADLDLAVLDLMHRINIRGTFVVNQQAARRVRAGGAIINFSTSVTRIALPTYAGYAASKGAVDAVSLILARELRGRDITVNAVAPGPIATPLFLNGNQDPDARAHLESMSPLDRMGTPADVAEVVAFLAGPGRWINGQTLYANGGAIR
jgi:3-oxoacyl-[acyl-carrier protein] reductase